MQCDHKQNETIIQHDAKVILIHKDFGCAIQIVITPALEGIIQNCMVASRIHISQSRLKKILTHAKVLA